jgi:hypothetical protein
MGGIPQPTAPVVQVARPGAPHQPGLIAYVFGRETTMELLVLAILVIVAFGPVPLHALERPERCAITSVYGRD